MNLYNVLRSPVVSEKSNDQRDKYNQYTFKVDIGADKGSIAKAVAQVYDVKVLSVATRTLRGKVKKRGMITSKLANYKKATVTLAPGQKIPIFDDN